MFTLTDQNVKILCLLIVTANIPDLRLEQEALIFKIKISQNLFWIFF